MSEHYKKTEMNRFSSNIISCSAGFSKIIKTLSLLVLMLLPGFSFAQTFEGSVHYLNTENIRKKFAALDYLNQGSIADLANGYIDTYRMGNISTNFSMLYLNASKTKYVENEENENVFGYEKSEFTITRDFSKHTLHDLIEVHGKTYIIEDTLKAPRWLIRNDMKEVAGHVCMNAFFNDTLKHQQIIALYALDIPVAAGPERFFGLPGLILEVDINDGALVITADKIEGKKLTTELDFPKKAKGKKIREKDYIEILRKIIADNRKQHNPLFNGLWY